MKKKKLCTNPVNFNNFSQKNKSIDKNELYPIRKFRLFRIGNLLDFLLLKNCFTLAIASACKNF